MSYQQSLGDQGATIDSEMKSKDDQILQLTGTLSTANGTIATQKTQIADLTAELEACKAAQKPPDPTPVPPDPTPVPPTGFKPMFPGDCKPGNIRLGVSLPLADSSVPIGVHRTYYDGTAGSFTKALATIDADFADNTISWVSFKPGTKVVAGKTVSRTWADNAGGMMDADFTKFCNAVKAKHGVVIVTFHHEFASGKGAPDDSGGPTQHLAWNKRMRGIITSTGAKNISLTLITISQTCSVAGILDQYWDSSVYDFFSVDGYIQNNNMSHQAYIKQVLALAKKWKTKLAYGEWGCYPDASGVITDSYNYFLGLAAAEGVHLFCASYFNSSANSVVDWSLTGHRLTEFTACCKLPTSVLANAA